MVALLSLRESIASGIGIATGFAIGIFTNLVFRRLRRNHIPYDSEEDDSFDSMLPFSSESQEAHKLVFCVRTDLKMQKGKIAAQVGHATLGAYKKAAKRIPAALNHWERSAQPKIALQIRSQKEAKELEQKAARLGLVTYMVYDAGRTQIAAGSLTVLAIGPGPVSLINQVTGRLKLL